MAHADLEEVAEDAEDRADDEDGGPAQTGERGVDVLAVGHVPLVPGVDGRGDAAGEGDVRAHERAEGQVVEAEGAAGGREDPPGGEHAEADEHERVVAADGGADGAACDGGQEAEEEDPQRSCEHPCSFLSFDDGW